MPSSDDISAGCFDRILNYGMDEAIPIDLNVSKLSYTITDKPGNWWQRITAIQMPWEWLEKGQDTHILRNVSFKAKSGQLTAIMGGSGSGKTSLLDVITRRATSGTVTGNVYLNNVECTKEILNCCSGYVKQDDRLIAFLTVRETLTFIARLKLPKSSSKETVSQRVSRVISELGLKHVADTRVGGESIRGLSGGERRRVSIGVQLLILPSLLFLDEPTTGLDSFTAGNLVQTLARLASKRRTIIMSIHQPRYDIFKNVDAVMILSQGQIVYNGPGRDMVSYFTTLGFPCPEHTNPCDVYIDLATVDNKSRDQEMVTSNIVTNLHAAYEVQEDAIELFESGEVITETQFKLSVDSGAALTQLSARTDSQVIRDLVKAFARIRASPGLGFQIWIILRRFFRVMLEDYRLFLTQFMQAFMLSILLGMAYYELLFNQQSIRDWFGLMFMMSIMYPYMVILGLIGVCHEERKFLYFELQDNLYHPGAYYVAKILSELPQHLVLCFINCIPVYGMAGLDWDPYPFLMFYVFVSMSVFTCRVMAMMTAAIFPTFQIAGVMAQTIFCLMTMSAGFLLNIENMLEESRWISQASFLRWSFQALSIIQIKELTFSDGPNMTVIRGRDAMGQFGVDGGDLWQCAFGLTGAMTVFLVMYYVAIRYLPQRPMNE